MGIESAPALSSVASSSGASNHAVPLWLPSWFPVWSSACGAFLGWDAGLTAAGTNFEALTPIHVAGLGAACGAAIGLGIGLWLQHWAWRSASPPAGEDSEAILPEVLPIADAEARRYHHHSVNPAHVLLALVRVAGNTSLFQALDLQESRVRNEVEELMAAGPPAGLAEPPLLKSRRLEPCLQAAKSIAQQDRRLGVRAEDLLWALPERM